jgi:hypothetical protein
MFTLFTPGQIVQFGLQIPWSTLKSEVPKEFRLGSMVRTAPYKNYVNKLVFNLAGGIMEQVPLAIVGCHLVEVPLVF